MYMEVNNSKRTTSGRPMHQVVTWQTIQFFFILALSQGMAQLSDWFQPCISSGPNGGSMLPEGGTSKSHELKHI